MGFLSRLFGRDQRAMPDPGSPEFQQMVEGSAQPGPQAPQHYPGMPGSMPQTEPGEQAFFGAGAQAPAVTPEALIAAGVPPEHAQQAAAAYSQALQAFSGRTHTLNLQGMEGLRDEMREVMRQHGVDPDSGVAMDASSIPGLQEDLLKVLAQHGVDLSQYWGR
jgi:hypothetical protein